MAITYVGREDKQHHDKWRYDYWSDYTRYTAIDDDVAIVICSGRHNNGSSLAPSDPFWVYISGYGI